MSDPLVAADETGAGAAASDAEPVEAGNGSDGGSDDDAGGSCVGALILRGNRCVLIRSLDGEWDGMRIPWLVAERGESTKKAAWRVVSEVCEIEEDEVHLLQEVLPVSIPIPGMPIAVHVFYARNPPPPGPLENADVEDPEDAYDWYTFPRAMAALANDAFARAALATVACALASGAAAGTVPSQWGGVFGQEWTEQAFALVPGPGKACIEIEGGGCTVESLVAAAAAASEQADEGEAKRSRTGKSHQA